MRKSTKGGTPATICLARANVPFKLHGFDQPIARGGIGIAAADILGLAYARILKTLIVACDGGGFAMALIRVDAELDLKSMAAALGCKKVSMADVKSAERITGYIRGAISPFGQTRRITTLIDGEATKFATVFVSGGRRGLEIELAPCDLLAVLGAKPAAVARR